MAELATLDLVAAPDGVVHGRITGELDAASTPAIRARLDAALASAAAGLVLDLSGVTFLDSSGVELLFRLRANLTMRAMRLTVVVPAGAPIRRTLEVSDSGAHLLEIVEAPPDGRPG
ncbi:MAG TPA: STAS domain-containing protein [Baekduia sp.]|nr:STAS domain-containing protein [Baekduia sp.]